MKSPARMGLARWLIKSQKAPFALIRGVPENGHAGRAKEASMAKIIPIALTRMQIVYRHETGDVWRMYSPKNKQCRSKIKKFIGGWLVSVGATLMFGKYGWKTYRNEVEHNDTV